ncbi:hypothetical protein GIB67_039554 [Kingdonia uniflora]|uniref:Uncharacterized protein n=1 Tax=Kingdonia uniflora TaxID=39325 RepID=A0A7J7P8P2_9MAGN|nr:hypothetical protein GIB67_039554 [Kingdonia uniflora]
MYHGWVSSRGGEGLEVRPIKITGRVGNVLVQTSCSEDDFERMLEGKAFVRMVIIAFVIGTIRLPRSDFDWERDAPYGVCLNVRFGVCVTIFAELGGMEIGGSGRLVMLMAAGSNVWYIFSTALAESVSSETTLAESVFDGLRVSG